MRSARGLLGLSGCEIAVVVVAALVVAALGLAAAATVSSPVEDRTRTPPVSTIDSWLAEVRACNEEHGRLELLESWFRSRRERGDTATYRSLIEDEIGEVRALALSEVARSLQQIPVENRDRTEVDAVVRGIDDPSVIVQVFAAGEVPILVFREPQRFAEVRARSVDVLVSATAHESGVVRRQAASRISSLAGILEASDVVKLESMLASEDVEVRRGGVGAMRRLASSSSKARELLRASLADEDALVRVTAAGGWLETGGEFEDVRALLVAAFDHEDAIVRSRVVHWIGAYGREHSAEMTSLLVRGLDDDARHVRSGCCGHLGSIEADAAACQEQLLECLASEDRIVREGSAFALGAIRNGDPIAIVPRLVDVAQSDPDETTRNWALVSIGRYAARNVSDLAPRLASMLDSDDETERLDALKVITNVAPGSPSTLPLATRALEDGSAVVRMWAAYALGKAGDAAEAAIPALTRALDDAEASVVAYACWALESCGAAAKSALEALDRCGQSEDSAIRDAAVRAATAIRAAIENDTPDDSVGADEDSRDRG